MWRFMGQPVRLLCAEILQQLSLGREASKSILMCLTAYSTVYMLSPLHGAFSGGIWNRRRIVYTVGDSRKGVFTSLVVKSGGRLRIADCKQPVCYKMPQKVSVRQFKFCLLCSVYCLV